MQPPQDRSLLQVVKRYFNALPDKDDEDEIIRQVHSGVTFRGTNLWILVFAIFIASLGLNVNSTAVIIGAMLISPLMGPIIGMGLSVGIGDLDLLRRSITNYLVATVISVLTATVYFLLTPLTEARSELLARTSPTLYDVLIALCGGAAGILALSTRGKGNVLPGVAIATALMPPLCTAGYGLAVGRLSFFLGAFYLFFINTVFIALATFIGVRMLRFRRKAFLDPTKMAKVNRYIIVIVIATMLPAAYMTVQIIRASMLSAGVRRFVRAELTFPGTQIISEEAKIEGKVLRVVAVGHPISPADIARARLRMKAYSLADYHLDIIQGMQSDSILSHRSGVGSGQLTAISSEQYLALKSEFDDYRRFARFTPAVAHELRTLFPEVRGLSMGIASESAGDSMAVREYVQAVVSHRGALSPADRSRMQIWLRSRVQADSLRVLWVPAE